MRKIREILRLNFECGLSARKIAKSCGISRNAVAECLQRAKKAGISWPIPEELDNGRLEALLYSSSSASYASPRVLNLPNWAEIEIELKKKGVTRQLLWEEYLGENPEGYMYSRFCKLYSDWKKTIAPSMRQTHKAGDKCFVDYAGPTINVIDPESGEIKEAFLFVGVLGASSFTYAEAHFHQDLFNWTSAHVRMLNFFKGAPLALVPDNLKSGVKKACFYEPEINPTYNDLAVHYGCAVVPARPGKPKDKAKVEAGVLIAERWILARIRNHTFFSLSGLNDKIFELLDALNTRKMRHFGLSRNELFEQLDRPALRPLPPLPYTFALWKKARVNIDYHIAIESHFYSVPFTLIHQLVDARITDTAVEIFHNGKRVASHIRSHRKGFSTTFPEHRPPNHRNTEWSQDRFMRWASAFGPYTVKFVEALLASRLYPEHAYRSCLGILRLDKTFGPERLEAACRRAHHFCLFSWRGIKNILDNNLDHLPLPSKTEEKTLTSHENVRGKNYYK